MAYKCVHCSEVYGDNSSEVLSGCGKCKGKFFFYIKEEKLRQIAQHKIMEAQLDPEEKKQMEEDIREIAGIENEDSPVFLDFESVSVLKPGKYMIDVTKLFSKDKPRVYKLEDGKYIVDLQQNKNTEH